ncbi:iron-sulfur cluster repair protein YtfE [Marinobacter zhejiangensis]|uniref:Regulator of cell morphogenesis and NO signaling n=1 Tax=Marinobacter zhejiangensis TaxID=488535 RepID=A0A1I4SWF8_9GAMM|nr:iron-sulfur cluster repair protein YtfE [Marinobacter zhejiangensis]SFM68761.1 regulator of cell morphogenesis and NO signaling [Marinobacter zhejiangensis]
MITLSEQPIGQLARDLPGATAVFHRFKLDFCCGGGQSLREVATRKGINLADVLEALSLLQQDTPDLDLLTRLDDQPLVEHILTRYHDVHREQLPELIRLAQRVERVHGGHPSCPAGLSAHLEEMAAELEAHMQKEEKILFPMITRGMAGMAVAPVQVMRHEHDDHGAALDKLLALTHDLTLPEGACNTWQALYRGLQTLRNDLMEHIHLENNVLFQRVDGQLGGEHHG